MDSAGGAKQRKTGEQFRRVPQKLIIYPFVYHTWPNNARGVAALLVTPRMLPDIA
jgi:hypothetical protein